MPEHQWRKKKSYKGSPYEERYCPVCDTNDIRSTEGRNRTWEVNTPCIKPVPERVGFDDLIADLAAHPVKVYIDTGITRVRTFEGSAECRGRPGKWVVGLNMGVGFFPGNRVLEPDVTYQTIEEACAAFLRWMRARQYDPYKRSHLRHAEQLERSRHAEFSDD